MLLDCHVHLSGDAIDRKSLLSVLDAAGVDGCILLSLPPASFAGPGGQSAADRLANLETWCRGETRFVPFYWVDPVEPDAGRQVELALREGVRGFKVIANRFFPGDPRALPVYSAIAAAGRPILFHSGILWDGRDSSRYCRPAEFESLLDVPGLRFALAHASWPWCDECLAVFGKFEQARRARPDLPHMFIDLTPGTPPIYREDLLRKIFTIGYDIEGSLLWGSDSVVPGYDPKPVRAWFDRDRRILNSLGVGEEAREGLFHRNLERFLEG
jgi:predicted TIM-barrel fold metal-dependent hydrolase